MDVNLMAEAAQLEAAILNPEVNLFSVLTLSYLYSDPPKACDCHFNMYALFDLFLLCFTGHP